ncbi:MAG: HAD family hydrolase [Roseburia sp. 40_7]|nr:MAG: HAD family hydrolase [Roseburia sp. 40_7]
MHIFCMDLDNTIIYSYKHDIGNEKINVEIYQGREISFITKKTQELLLMAKEKYMLIPTSTRTVGQYERIDLGIGAFPYALVCNGGILLVNGKRDRAWYETSLDLIRESSPELEKAMGILEHDKRRKFELRFIERLFVFTKCNDPEEVVYVVPKKLSKGMAVRRLREKLKPESIMAAGDSGFDISMVEEADHGFVPYGFTDAYQISDDRSKIMEMEPERLFSEALLEKALKMSSPIKI